MNPWVGQGSYGDAAAHRIRTDTGLTIKLGHLFTQFNFSKNGLELRLIDTGDEPASHVGERLAERRIKDLQSKLSLGKSKLLREGREGG